MLLSRSRALAIAVIACAAVSCARSGDRATDSSAAPAMAAMSMASQPSTQADAHQLHTKQAAEQKRMIEMVQSMYGETVTPMVMPEHKAMIDALQAKSGAEYDRTFYRDIIAHHREALKMVDDFRPRFTKPDIRQMAEKMKADQQKEIADFERKAK